MPEKKIPIYLSTNLILWLKELLEHQLEYWNKQPAHYKWANINKAAGTLLLKKLENTGAQSILENWCLDGNIRTEKEQKERQTTKDHECFHTDSCQRTGLCFYTQKPPVASCKWTDLITKGAE